MTDIFTIVAFRYDRKNSILYSNKRTEGEIAQLVVKALGVLEADVISIRRVKTK